MPQLKKIDYRELGKEAPQPEPQEGPQREVARAEEKVSFFASLGNHWGLMDKKTKIEIFALVVVILAIVGVGVFYFSSVKKPEFRPPASYSRPAIE